MTGNPFNNPMMSMMYQDALQSLYAGAVLPHERELLAMAPLPADIVDPFASQDVDPLHIMDFAYNSLVTWIDEAKKANYFSKHFTDLSKLVLKGVMTMGRGLVTLHNRGEDLAQAPMQIGDLISVASYHFRKSYLGVIQTAKSNPEISERLLLNQLSWTNMLLRLYKTKDKLNQKSEIGNKKLDMPENEERRSMHSELPDGKTANSECFLHNSSLNEGQALPDVAALFEPAGFSAPRALTTLDRSKGSAGSRETVRSLNNNVRSVDSQEQTRDRTADSETNQSNTHEQHEKKENNKLKTGKTEVQQNKKEENKAEETKKNVVSNEKPETENPETDNSETSETTSNQQKTETPESSISGHPAAPEENSGNRITEAAVPEFCEIQNEQQKEIPVPSERPEPEKTAETISGQDPCPIPAEDLSYEKESAENAPPDHPPAGMDLPLCLQIMKKVITSSEKSGDGSLTFTFDEIRYLANDPVFSRIDPGTAADMRKMLRQIDSG